MKRDVIRSYQRKLTQQAKMIGPKVWFSYQKYPFSEIFHQNWTFFAYENSQISYINLQKGCKRQTMWLRINWFHVEQQRNRSGIHFGRCRCFNCQSVQSSGFRRIRQFHIRFISLKTIFIFITFYIGFEWNIFNIFNTVEFSIFFYFNRFRLP